MPSTRRARAVGMGMAQPWGAPHHPGITIPVSRLLAGAGWLCQPGAAPGGETHQFLQPCCTMAPAGKAKPSQKHGHSVGSMQPPSASGEGRRCQPHASPTLAPLQPQTSPMPSPCQAHTIARSHRAGPSPWGRSSPPGRTGSGSARGAPDRGCGRWGGRGGRRRCIPVPRRTAELETRGRAGQGPPLPHSCLVPLPPHAGGSSPPASPGSHTPPQPHHTSGSATGPNPDPSTARGGRSPAPSLDPPKNRPPALTRAHRDGDGDSRHSSWLLHRMWMPRRPHSSA